MFDQRGMVSVREAGKYKYVLGMNFFRYQSCGHYLLVLFARWTVTAGQLDVDSSASRHPTHSYSNQQSIQIGMSMSILPSHLTT
ncbi:hypothetical protein M405DRAFT_620798 [Rhizopogon salebrosus TDB-379]|nr:hypothetical protein M405DRAFT_637274 [Rhizopogon salebrosus TDB-379]KAJ8597137.1 hypothetical protein M405DRAFT_620798 [Rhizopogon salebrosus TDB-379]